VKERFIQFVNHSTFPISLLVVVCLIAGLLSFQDFGMSWDEPLFYKYADAIPYAYSISERLSGDFNILNAYGPSETDHMMYGPAYIILARPFVLLTSFLFNVDNPSGWHLVNFILFILSSIFIYLISLRWMNRWAAFSATLLYISQPLLWGHAFINPKDIPFTSFFIIAIYTGFRMVDSASVPQQKESIRDPQSKPWKWVKVFLWIFFAILVIASITVVLFDNQIRSWIPELIRGVYNHPESTAGKIFLLLTNNPGGSNVDAYVIKGNILLDRIPFLLVLCSVIVGLFTFLVTFKADYLWHFIQSIRINISRRETIFAGVSLGLLTAIRILGPFAGILVSIYFILRSRRRALSGIFFYSSIAFIIMFIFWPYLWHSPVSGVIAVIKHMANNPQIVPVLFNGQVISSNALPASYLPIMLGLTLTEPVWILFVIGMSSGIYLVFKKIIEWKGIFTISLWFLLPFLYAIMTTPPQYDGFRHFTFLVPPVFIICGFAFNMIFEINPIKWLNPVIILLLVLPGIAGIVRLHPYEYTYYNTIIGGTKGAFRKYETDYWLTCYKEVFNQLKNTQSDQQKVFVHRNKYLASQYGEQQFLIEQFEPDRDSTSSGDLLLLSTRSNKDEEYHRDDPTLLSITRDGAVYCVIKMIK
jgi:hypothetical protein